MEARKPVRRIVTAMMIRVIDIPPESRDPEERARTTSAVFVLIDGSKR